MKQFPKMPRAAMFRVGRIERNRSIRFGRRSRTGLVAAVALTASLALAGCTPPTTGSNPPIEGRGKIPEVTVAPSEACTAGSTLPVGRSTVHIPTRDGNRYALVDVPAAPTDGEPAPLVLSLHPFTVGMQAWDGYSGLAAAGTARGYVVVTPLGSDPGPRWAVPGGLPTGIDDIGFLMKLVNQIEDSTCIDRNRQFAAGFSAGAAMAQALSCTASWRMAAVAGSGGTNLTSTCPNASPTDVMVLHGSADPIAPLTGSEVIFAPPLGLAVDTVVSTNASRAGCEPTPTTEQLTNTVVIDRYNGCSNGHRVEYWRLIGAGHTWAGTTSLLDFIAGPTNTDISATERVLDFFDTYQPPMPQ
jgi:polyhydroxybutyrate depolymerase